MYEDETGGLLIIDQHAAHERIGFESFKREWSAGKVRSQSLLAPLVLDLSAAEVAVVTEKTEFLERLGFRVEPFGGTSVAVTEAPALLVQSASDLAALLGAVAAELLEWDDSSAVERQVDHILMTMACHRQVRAGDRLSLEEQRLLLQQMMTDPVTDRCPHGRPSWIKITKTELARRFGRS